MSAKIPEPHRDLLQRPLFAILTTLMPDGQPQSSLIWVDLAGDNITINTTLERQKCRNMQRDTKVSLLIIDPANGDRFLSVRGDAAAFTRENAEEHADKLTRQYTDKEFFYGEIHPAEMRDKETRVIVQIEPVKVYRDGYF